MKHHGTMRAQLVQFEQRVALLEVIGGSGGHVVLAVDDLFGQASAQCHAHAILQELLGVEAWQGHFRAHMARSGWKMEEVTLESLKPRTVDVEMLSWAKWAKRSSPEFKRSSEGMKIVTPPAGPRGMMLIFATIS